MTPEREAKLQTLEEQLAADPDSESLREQILFEYLGGPVGEPRRIHHAVEYVRRFPRELIARTPYVQVNGQAFPEAFAQLEEEWRRHLAEAPDDSELIQGYAALVAPGDPDRAAGMLEGAIENAPEDAGLWLELGRICPEPVRRLSALQKARALGAEQPNLLTWVARAALEADDKDAATEVANELLRLVAEARSRYGDKVDWKERGRDARQRARAATDSDGAARELVHAICEHNYRKHWAETTLGVVAARQGNMAEAIERLRASASVGNDFRLSSYGPALQLARELCALGEWDAAADYLEECSRFWNPEPLRGWVEQLRQRQLPEALEE